MNSDTPRPGEVDLESYEPDPPAPEDPPVADPPAATSAAEATADDPPADGADPEAEGPSGDEPPAPRQKPGLVQELVETRAERKLYKQQLDAVQPVLARLTPDLQQAILEGRVQVAPPKAPVQADDATLRARAERLRLYTTDAQGNQVLDLDAAARVEREIREVAGQVVEPVRQSLVAKDADANVQKAIAHAAAGLPKAAADFMKAEYLSVRAQANGAQLLADPVIAENIWYTAIGKAHAQGLLTDAQAGAPRPTQGQPPARKPAAAPTPHIAEPSGRRSAAPTVALSPSAERVYRDAGLDPTKGFSTTNPQRDLSGGIALE